MKSRDRAQDLIKNGHAIVDGIPARKTTRKVDQDISITINAPEIEWVDRGALKLLAALDYFDVNPAGLIAADALPNFTPLKN